MIWLIGSGEMSKDYVKVLRALNENYIVIGRGETSAKTFREETGEDVFVGGLGFFLGTKPIVPDKAIVSVSIQCLCEVALQLIEYGVKHILLEKPGGISRDELEQLSVRAKKHSAIIHIAYNRRFYSSVIAAKKIINEDGGVLSYNFEFTEWSHIIDDLSVDTHVKRMWFLSNSSHVVDMAFYLGGKPKQIHAFTGGKDLLSWHPVSSIFAGSGVSEQGAQFSYQANWVAPGRWSVEVSTRYHRLIFRPLELLQIQNIGSIRIESVDIDDSLDKKFKPGLFLEVKSFAVGNYQRFCSLDEHVNMLDIYYQIAGY